MKMRLAILTALASCATALYMTLPTERLLNTALIPTPTPTSTVTENDGPTKSVVVSSSITSPPAPSITFSALMTIAPLSPNPLEARQRCFNDQGFSVNCAQWTGYYYTWGGASHPYAGGPGDGGGSGSSSAARSDAAKAGMSNSLNVENGFCGFVFLQFLHCL